MDAMYLAGMVADGSKLTKAQLNKWAKSAVGLQMISEYTVPWLAVENCDGTRTGAGMDEFKGPAIAATGWCTYSGLVVAQAGRSIWI